MPLNLEAVQSRFRAITNYEHVLADELESIYGRGVYDLDGIVAALNETGVRPPDGQDWTTGSFTAELARLGQKEDRT